MSNEHFFKSLVEAMVDEPDVVVTPTRFLGTLEADDSNPDKPWAYLKIDQGIPKAAYEYLRWWGIPCEPRYEHPHITVIKNDEAKELIEKFGKDKWKEYVEGGPEQYFFEIYEMVDLDPEGWDSMDRVWFMRCEAPGLSAHRTHLGLTPLPTGQDGQPQDFHITVAVRPATDQVQEESVRQRSFLIETLKS